MKCFSDLLKKFKPHVINCYRGEFFFIPSIRRMFIKKPAVIRFRGDIRIPRKGKINKILHRAGSDLIITSAEFIKDYYTKYLHIHSGKIRVLYGGVDTCKFKKDDAKRKMERRKLHYKDSDFVIAIVGRFDPVKGHNFLIDAIRDLYYR